MKTLVSMLALGLIVSFSAPAFAGTKVPTTQSECTKAGITGIPLRRSAPRACEAKGRRLRPARPSNEQKGNRDEEARVTKDFDPRRRPRRR